MSMIKAVKYSATVKEGAVIFSETIEFFSEIDTLPLTQDQLDNALARVREQREAILKERLAWEEGRKQTPAEAPAAQQAPKEAGQATLEGGITPPVKAPEPAMKCIVCGTVVEPRTSPQTGTPYSFCPKCKENRRKDGTEFPKKGAR